jgi:predicted MFS family arabinose efflux permease
MGIIGAAFGLGFVFGPPIGGLLFSKGGLYYVGMFTAALCVLNFVLAFLSCLDFSSLVFTLLAGTPL